MIGARGARRGLLTCLGAGVVAAALGVSGPARASAKRGTARVLLVLGGPGRNEDVARAAAVFAERGFVPRERIVAVPDATQPSVSAGFSAARQLASRFAPEEVLLVVVAVGEGDRETIALRDGPLHLGTVTTLGGDIPAALHVVVTEVCERGAQTSPELWLGRPERGPTWLRVSGPCGGRSLTADWLTGLEGAADTNADRRITLGESYAFVASQAAERGGVRTGGPFVDEASAAVLTHDAEPSTELSLRRGRGITYRVFEYGALTPLVEVRSLDSRDVRVQVPPGRLVVHVFGGGRSGALELRMERGELRYLGPEESRPEAAETLAREGGALSRASHEFSASYGGALGGYASFAHGGAVRYAYASASGAYAAQLVGTAVLAGESSAVNENILTTFGARLRLERRFFTGTPLLAIGVGAIGEVVAQSLRRLDANQVLLTGYPTEERRRAAGGGPELYTSLRTTVGGTSFFGAELSGSLPVLRMGETLRVFPRLEGSLFAGLVY